jgi:hypothetical protein
MNKSVIICLLIASVLCGCATPMQQAEQQAHTAQLNTPVIEKVAIPFDEKQAKAALQIGDATIKGVLYHKVKTGGKDAGSDPTLSLTPASFLTGVEVRLYPETAHLTELLRLEKENRRSRAWSKNTQLKEYVPDERIFNYMLVTKTDKSGRYFFQKLKPGRYYVFVATQDIITTGSETVRDGTSVVSDGYYSAEVAHYRNQDFRVKTPVDYGETVEIKPGQKELKLESRMRYNTGHF